MNYAIQNMIYAWGPKDYKLRAVLLAIAAYADGKGVAYPGLLTLADNCCCDVRTVQRRLDVLERAGWMSIQRRARSVETARGWEKRGNIYQIHLSRLRGDAQGRMGGASSVVGSDARRGDVQDRLQSGVKDAQRGDENHRSRHEENAVRDDKTQLARRQNEPFETTKQAVRDDKIAVPLMNYQELPENYQSEEIPPKAPLASRAPVDFAPAPDAGVQLCLNVGEARTTASARATATTPVLQAPGVSMERGGELGGRVLPFRRMREPRDPHQARALLDESAQRLFDIAIDVLEACGIPREVCTRSQRNAVMAQLRLEVQTTGKALALVAAAGIEMWIEYQRMASAGFLLRVVGPKEFFRDGYWLDEARWGWDKIGMRERRRSQF
ncbi:hypothetical protein GOB94_13980 [Granulicella sp. 5B5]|uniref:helix-turn-helix domain-containing protein n=1 Tax=Granulicella sp. 5B5 TaxID=1617967 RepID=UPI0015F5FA0D|nr:helix-turn-helix domain-containing protein [Granulicella sp. 5B5]QMV19674.1 hypothetical protein GOB94_13980 [Granulicella sp. 5B5]